MSSVYSLSGAAGAGESWPSSVVRPASSADNVATPPALDDPKDTSTIPALSKVEELKGSQFQQVVTDAVTQLKVAAKQTSDPFAAGFLWNLANRFELALDSGQGLTPQQAASSAAAGGTDKA
jgi:hypothetical protein